MTDFENFKEFMLQSAARHDAEIATIRETLVTIRDSLASTENTSDRLVDNQIHLQESIDATQEEIRKTQEEIREVRRDTRAELAELSRIVFGHVTDRDAHTRL